MSTGAPVSPMRVPCRPPSVTMSWLGPRWGCGAVAGREPRRRAGGGVATRVCPLVRKSPRITRIEAKTNSHSSARKPKRMICSARAEFTRPPRRRSWVLLVEHHAGVAEAQHVAVVEHVAADLVAVDGGAVGRAEVVDGRAAAVVLDVQMPPGHALVEQLQVGLGTAADEI